MTQTLWRKHYDVYTDANTHTMTQTLWRIHWRKH